MTIYGMTGVLPLLEPTPRSGVGLSRPSRRLSSLWITAALLVACTAATLLVSLTPLASTWAYDWWAGVAALICLIAGLFLAGLVLFQRAVMDEDEMRLIGIGLAAVASTTVVMALFVTELTAAEYHAKWLTAGRAGVAAVGLTAIIAASKWTTSRLSSPVLVAVTLGAGAVLLAAAFAVWQPPAASVGVGLAGLGLVAAGFEVARYRRAEWSDHGWIAVALGAVAAAELLIAAGNDSIGYLFGASALTAAGFISAHTAIRANLLRRLRSDLSAVDALLETQRQLHEQQRSHERCIAQMAHDSRSNAAALESVVEIIANTPNAPADVVALSNALSDEVSRMRRTVAEIVDREIPLESHPVWDSIESVVRCRSAQVNELRVDVTYGVRAYADSDTLASIIDALMANAVEHGGGGLISVGVTGRANTAIISVDDDGPGVADVCRDIVFERGVTSKRDDHDGLGLFGAAERARSVGASIHVKTSVYGGARFEVHVPMTSTRSFVPMANARSGR